MADFLQLRRGITSQGLTLIDCPIGRGPDSAAARQHLFLVGGEVVDIDRIRPVNAPVCEEVVHCGPAGSAIKTKIINNCLASVSVVANAEALALANAAGLNRDLHRTLWRRTVAGRGALETIFPGKAFARDFTPGFSARLARKDLKLVQELGEHYGVPLATGAAAREMFTFQQTQGRIDEDWSALLDIVERMPPATGKGWRRLASPGVNERLQGRDAATSGALRRRSCVRDAVCARRGELFPQRLAMLVDGGR